MIKIFQQTNENNVSIMFPKNEITIVTIILYILKEHEHVVAGKSTNNAVKSNLGSLCNIREYGIFFFFFFKSMIYSLYALIV